MIKRFIIWHKVQNGVYKRISSSDDTMITLALFLIDGLGVKSYVAFLEDQDRVSFSGNISDLEKNDAMVTVNLDDYVFPNMPPFTTTIKNLIIILKEYRRLEVLAVDQIEISLENDRLMVNGDFLN